MPTRTGFTSKAAAAQLSSPLEVSLMACAKCNDLCVRYAIEHPSDLRQAIKIAKQNIEDATISEVHNLNSISQASCSELAAGEAWDDVLYYRFICTACGEIFLLHAETYHGSGGYWEPENTMSVRENL